MSKTKALWVNDAGFKLGVSSFGTIRDRAGSVKQIVHDGDTVKVKLNRNISIRYLGIDTAEVSFQFPGTDKFVHLTNDKWADFFTSGNWKEDLAVSCDLLDYLKDKIKDGNNVSSNQAALAELGHRQLENIVAEDLAKSEKSKEEFEFFMAFSHEFLDGYGRLLCYHNSSIFNYSDTAIRDEIKQFSYNERQLQTGAACPYFIWPNIQPFLKVKAFEKEHASPDGFWQLIEQSRKLAVSRDAVKEARNKQLGIFGDNTLIIEPFELRFISRKSGPSRYVIDLNDIDRNVIYHPEDYFHFNMEDRLFIPEQYTPIFEVFGWEVKRK